MKNSLKYVCTSLCIITLYIISGLLALKLAVSPSYISPLFPPAGIALAALIISGRRYSPAILIASMALNVIIRMQNGETSFDIYVISFLIAMGTTFQTLFAKYITRPFVVSHDKLVSEKNVFLFLLLAGPCSAVIGATSSLITFASFEVLASDAYIHTWLMWLVGDSIGVMIFTPIALTIYDSRGFIMNKRKRLAIYPSLILFGSVVWLFFHTSQEMTAKLRSQLEILGDQSAYNIDSALKRYGVILESVEGLFSTSEHVTRQEFHDFLKDHFSKYPGIRAINWNPVVEAHERRAFEMSVRKEGFKDFMIFEGKNHQRASERARYIPVRYTEPQEPNKESIGYDTFSNELRRAPMQRAIDERAFSISSKIQLVQDVEDVPSLGMFYPVFNKRNEQLMGFVVGLFRIDNLVTTSVNLKELKGINYLIYDVTSGSKVLLYKNIKSSQEISVDLSVSKKLEIGGRIFLFELFPTREYIARNADFTALTILLGGLILVILLQSLLMIILGRTEMIQRLVDEKTSELSKANHELSLVAETMSQDLVESTLNFKRLAEMMPDIVWVANDEGVLTDINSQWEAYSGYKLNEKSWKEFLHPEDLSETLEIWQRSIVTGIGYEAKYRIQSKDGDFQWFIVKSAPIRNLQGKVVKWFGTSTNIHGQICAEEEKTQLMIREKTALEASKMKSAFLANMSHEIRTPINGVVGMTHLLKDSPLNDEQRDFVRTIESSASSLLIIINDILDFSKVEAGKMDLEILDFDLEQTLLESFKSIEFLGRKKNIPLLIDLKGMPEQSLKGDAGRVRQVLTNLLNNAVKFTEAGQVSFEVFPIESTDTTKSYRFEIKDTGIGIEEKTLQKIFQPFDQADSSTTRRFGGTGLGLSISKQLVDLMRGKIGVESKPGKGSLFWFELKFERGENEPTAIRNIEKTLVPVSKKKVRVLLAEDNQVNQIVAIKQLEKLGCSCDVAANGLEAIQALKSIPYDLVLMDCQMPEMDGYEATRLIRSMNTTFSMIPIIAMTANAMTGDREKCLEAGMNDYVSKPISLADLSKVVENWGQKEILKLTS